MATTADNRKLRVQRLGFGYSTVSCRLTKGTLWVDMEVPLLVGV